MTILEHDNGMMSYNLDALNDKQSSSLFSIYNQDEIIMISISVNDINENSKIVFKDGHIVQVKFSMIGIRERIAIV